MSLDIWSLIISVSAFILAVILVRKFFKHKKLWGEHREPWDDISDIKFQKELNKERLRIGLESKEINYKTGRII